MKGEQYRHWAIWTKGSLATSDLPEGATVAWSVSGPGVEWDTETVIIATESQAEILRAAGAFAVLPADSLLIDGMEVDAWSNLAHIGTWRTHTGDSYLPLVDILQQALVKGAVGAVVRRPPRPPGWRPRSTYRRPDGDAWRCVGVGETVDA